MTGTVNTKGNVPREEFDKHVGIMQLLIAGVILVLLVAILGWYSEALNFKAASYQELTNKITELSVKIDLLYGQ